MEYIAPDYGKPGGLFGRIVGQGVLVHSQKTVFYSKGGFFTSSQRNGANGLPKEGIALNAVLCYRHLVAAFDLQHIFALTLLCLTFFLDQCSQTQHVPITHRFLLHQLRYLALSFGLSSLEYFFCFSGSSVGVEVSNKSGWWCQLPIQNHIQVLDRTHIIDLALNAHKGRFNNEMMTYR